MNAKKKKKGKKKGNGNGRRKNITTSKCEDFPISSFYFTTELEIGQHVSLQLKSPGMN